MSPPTPRRRPPRFALDLAAFALVATAALPACAATGGGGAGHRGEEPMDVLASAPRPVELAAGGTEVELVPPAGGPPLGERLDALAPGERVYLLLHDLHAAAQPGVLYELWVGLEAGERPAGDDPRYVGDLNFFDAVARTLPLRSYEVGAPLAALARGGRLGAPLTLSIRPAGDPAAEARPVVGGVELVVE